MTTRISTALMLFLVVVPLLLMLQASAENNNDSGIDHGAALHEWLRSKGGVFHEGLEFRQSGDTGMFSLYAKDDISEGTAIYELPQEIMLKPSRGHVGDRVLVSWEDDEYPGYISAVHKATAEDDGINVHDDNEEYQYVYDIWYDDGDKAERVEREMFEFESAPTNCATVRMLIDEMKKGDDSEYSAYINYLKDQKHGQLSATWSQPGKDMLEYVKGDLPPMGKMTRWLEEDWIEVCQGEPEYLHIASLVNQRSWDEVLIPMYDMLNHRNGRWLNTDSDSIREGKSVVVRATRDIKAGEQIYSSYNQCVDCQKRKEKYGTPQIFRDYGFVELYPQRWVFPFEGTPHTISFDLDTPVDDEGKESDDVVLTWNKKPWLAVLPWFQGQLRRLEEIGEVELDGDRDPRIPANEWDSIVEFFEAMKFAITKAIEALKTIAENDDGADDVVDDDEFNPISSYDCTKFGTCSVADGAFQTLEARETEEWDDSRPRLCDYHGIYDLAHWHVVEKADSQYQKMNFLSIPKFDDNMCFELDGTVQICEAYRPQYHEMAVIYTARWIENMKRVLFVGGGDSMLLHEILKYPTIEKVVALELDQQVTRGSFKYFGTQPHWDKHEKVEWWYGDATKSMLILPKDYFGSFDLVLVDLSETVSALTVTEELDVMQSLTLLLKPEGIMVKNEIMYFPEMKKMFKYAMHVHFYDVPVVCTQSLVFGSNNIDFLRAPVYNHSEVPYLYKLLDQHQLKIVHDYHYNDEAETYCRKKELTGDDSSLQKASPGILMVLDVEGVDDKVLSSEEKFKEVVVKALSTEDLNVIHTKLVAGSTDRIDNIFILNEGYIVAHVWVEASFCSFDIHLWSQFEKQDKVKKAILNTLVPGGNNGQVSSSYRIVAGGVFSTGNWREEQKNLGPLAAAPMCNDSDDEEDTKAAPLATQLNNALKDSIGLLSKSKVVAVVCGHEDKPCEALNLLNQDDTIDSVPLWSCPYISNSVAFEKDGAERMANCRKEIHKIIKSTIAAQGKKIDAIVLDPSTFYPMGQILNDLFSSDRAKNAWLSRFNITALAVYPTKGSSWRKGFVHIFKTSVAVLDPVFKSDVFFNNSSSEFGLSVSSAGNEEFLQIFLNVVKEIESSTGCTATIENIRGGVLIYKEDFEPAQFFSHSDYDNVLVDSRKQWETQQQLGFQSILQYEGAVKSCDSLKRTLEKVMTESDSEGAITIESFKDFEGDGCIIFASWSDGSSVVVLWDGRKHVDVNLFMLVEDWDFAMDFQLDFNRISFMKLILRDVQPRGPGRAVSFASDVADFSPHWVRGS